MDRFLGELERRLVREGFTTQRAQATALGIDPATWSRARRGRVRFSPHVVEGGLARFPELAFYLPGAPHAAPLLEGSRAVA